MTETAVRSEILHAGLIFSFVIDGQSFDRWTPEPDTDLQRRSGRLQLRIEAVRKGSLDQQLDQPFELAIIQRGTADRTVWDYYGLWSHTPTATGVRLTAFCDGEVTDARAALTDEHCDLLVATDDVDADLTMGLDLERRNASADEVLAEASRVKHSCGDLFGRYVWARTVDLLTESSDAFTRLMTMVEDPETTSEGRECYLIAAYEDATFSEIFTVEQEARLVRAMFRAALAPGRGELRSQILNTYIPNLVDHEPSSLTVADVFGTEAALLRSVREASVRSQDGWSDELRAWLAGGSV